MPFRGHHLYAPGPHNDVAADSVAFSTSSEKAGSGFRIVGDGAKWFAIAFIGQDSATVTVATA